MADVTCTACSRPLRLGSRFCAHCGAAQIGSSGTATVVPTQHIGSSQSPAIGATQRINPALNTGMPPTQHIGSPQSPAVGATQRINPALNAGIAPTQRPVAAPPGIQPSVSKTPPGSAPAPMRLTINRTTVIATLAGLVGGLIATVVLSILNVRDGAYGNIALALLIGGVVGTCIPGMLAAIPGLRAGQPRRAGQNAALAAGIGLMVMILIGLGLTRIVSREAIFFQGDAATGALAWIVFGLALGMVEGIVWRSAKRAVLGAAGGSLGALLAFGLGTLLNNEGAFVLVGPLVGFGANLLPEMFKTAWVQVVNGTRQFEVTLDKAQVIFGRSDNPRDTDVGLYGDREIAPRHFAIARQGNAYLLHVLPNAGAVRINGVPITSSSQLRQGDQIEAGRAQIRFYTKQGH